MSEDFGKEMRNKIHTRVADVDDKVSGILVQVPFFVTMDTIVNNTITLFNFDALGCTIREILISFYLPLHAAATFTPTWERTRVGAPVTYIAEVIPAIANIVTPAANAIYRYHCGEIAAGLMGRFRIAQSNNAPVVSVVAFAVVVMEL